MPQLENPCAANRSVYLELVRVKLELQHKFETVIMKGLCSSWRENVESGKVNEEISGRKPRPLKGHVVHLSPVLSVCVWLSF